MLKLITLIIVAVVVNVAALNVATLEGKQLYFTDAAQGMAITRGRSAIKKLKIRYSERRINKKYYVKQVAAIMDIFAREYRIIIK